ncbi:MAG: hypothetical protein RMY28_027620 [Nostoc sp. ChiSLP01]
MQNYATGYPHSSPISVQQVGDEWALWGWGLGTGEEILLQQFSAKYTAQ